MIYEVCCSPNNRGLYVTLHCSSPLLLLRHIVDQKVDVTANGLGLQESCQNSGYTLRSFVLYLLGRGLE